MSINITIGELLKLYQPDEDGTLRTPYLIYDIPDSGTVRYPCEITAIEKTKNGGWFSTNEYEVSASLDEQLTIKIYEEVNEIPV